ncbi:MAG TPA: hypothetical protein VF691_00045 [Cytophagaceae bacterium]|jgi:hypothetical protein
MNNEKLIQLAQALQPEEEQLAACWNLVICGLEVGWLDKMVHNVNRTDDEIKEY